MSSTNSSKTKTIKINMNSFENIENSVKTLQMEMLRNYESKQNSKKYNIEKVAEIDIKPTISSYVSFMDPYYDLRNYIYSDIL